ncbi:hypothetical protein B0A49_03208 [Cryomyces minteri]|uniref:RRM domain-containing protein n=1 Tax=Cryomyces minteri TaxID=331657 RepID=A0A4U0XCJ7_9PEZI|nr:hypothetical protein B0A49_03208 [Cryomyces minteri]
MADEDNFDIDIYGDEGPEYQEETVTTEAVKEEDTPVQNAEDYDPSNEGPDALKREERSINRDSNDMSDGNFTQPTPQAQQIASTGGSAQDQLQVPKQAPIQQGVKRKEGEDEREIDPGATSALKICELHWWTTEDDIRGWANQCSCEDELKDVTFNEHKVNGKSKGEAYVELRSPQAATALKRKIESFGSGQQYIKKHTVFYHTPHNNPYRTLPKDAPNRNKEGGFKDNRPNPSAYVNGMAQNNFNSGGGFRGGRGGFNNRGNIGGMGNMSGNFNNNRGNFSGSPMGGMPTGGYGSPMAAGFGGSPMGMQGFNNFNRAGMMGGMNGMRGGGMAMRGRGGMMNGMAMGGMPMSAMNMGMGMPGNMGMNMGMGVGGMAGPGGFAGSPQQQFNPAFFGQSSPGGMGGNPHGAKRPRPE